jgi:hypothetical protein
MLCHLRKPEVLNKYVISIFGSKNMPGNKPAKSGCLLVSCLVLSGPEDGRDMFL